MINLREFGRRMRRVAGRLPRWSGVLLGMMTAAAGVDARGAERATLPPPSPAALRLDVELTLWNDPAFRRQFAASYMAETDVEPKVAPTEREAIERALEDLASGKLEEAARRLERANRPGASAVFDFMLGNLHFQQERFDEAEAAYRAAVEKFPRFRRAWRNLATLAMRRREFDKALPALTRTIELGGGDALTYGLLGFAYSGVERHVEAESAFRQALLMDPQTFDWSLGLARSLVKQGRWADAAALSRQLIDRYPDRSELWLIEANARLGLNEPIKAAEIFEWLDQWGRSTPPTLLLLGDIYVNEGLFEQAVRAYRRALDQAPPGREAAARLLRAAQVLAARGAAAPARELLDAVKGRMGGQWSEEERKTALKLEARLAVAGGAGAEEEARILEEVVALDPLDGEALLLLGRYYERAGDPERAVFYYERAQGLEAFEADARVRHAQLLVRQGRYEEAVPLLRRAQQLRPRDNVQQYLEQVERAARAR